MKKLLSAALFSAILISSLFCAPKSPVMEPIQIQAVEDQGEINKFIVDPRIELVGMVCRLAEIQGFMLNYTGDNAFLSQMDTLFAKYKEHKIVKTAKSLNKKGIDSSAMISLAYHIKPDFSGTIIDFSPFPETLYFAWKKIGTKAIYDFVKQLHDFAVESNFQRIYTLNNGSYIYNVGNMKKDIEKVKIAQWTEEFFNTNDFEKPVITVSAICAGGNYYDFVVGSDGKRLAYFTTYPGTSYINFENCYINFFTQIYATNNWDAVKENYIKYNMDYVKKYNPSAIEEAKKLEITDYDLAILMGTYCYLAFLKQKGPELENHPSFEEIFGALEKKLGDPNILKAAALIDEYSAARDKYPTFNDFAPRLNEFINTIAIEE